MTMDRENLRDWAALLGRTGLCAIFLVSAYTKVTDWNGMQQLMEERGMPWVSFFLLAALLLEGLGAVAVLLGYKARLGALALVVFLVPTTFIFHNFWTMPADQQALQTVMFLKNLGIIGGLLMLAANGPGRFSLGRESTSVQQSGGSSKTAESRRNKTPVWSSSTQ